MATFKIATSNGNITEYNGTYTIGDGGVLSVVPDRGNPLVFSPSGWLCIEVTDAPVSAREARRMTALYGE